MINIIAAIDENNAIGKDGHLMWHMPADMKYFKDVTVGHTVIMGRKTYDALLIKPLPDRHNIVITRSEPKDIPDVTVVNSIDEALLVTKSNDVVYIIGGSQIFKQTIDRADRLYITRIHHTFDRADAFFPIIGSEWKCIYTEPHDADDKNPYDYTFEMYERK